jgi:hypothetical protein
MAGRSRNPRPWEDNRAFIHGGVAALCPAIECAVGDLAVIPDFTHFVFARLDNAHIRRGHSLEQWCRTTRSTGTIHELQRINSVHQQPPH